MFYGLIIIFAGYLISAFLINSLFNIRRDIRFMFRLMYYHTFISIVYYLYALFNPSDSKQYYRKILENYRGENWTDYYGVSTTFIEWLGFPFIKYLNFNYESCMALFSLLGFIGFIFFYKIIRERVLLRPKLFGKDLIWIILLLPNLHFWSASFGKGPVIFLGIALYFYGLNKFNRRWLLLVLGALITYHVRPHILFVTVVSTVLGMVFSGKGIGWFARLVVLAGSITALIFIYQDVLLMVGIENTEEITDAFNLSQRDRVEDLTKATSGIDISSYPLPLQVFTFLFRPLFFDAPGMLGIIVSFENVFLLFLTLRFFANGGFIFLFRGDFLIKTGLFSFLTVTIALAQIAGNLGLAIRQKSQVMLLFLIIVIELFDKIEVMNYRNQLIRRENRIRKLHGT